MKSRKFYIIIEKSLKEIKELISNLGIKTNSVTNKNKIEAIEFYDFKEANEIYQRIIQVSETDNSNYWNYILLNEIGFEEFKELRDKQKFNLRDLINKENEEINLTNLEVKMKGRFGGGVIIGKKAHFKSAFNFWINSVTKITRENFEVNADLYGGTYNPITLRTLEKLISNSCGDLTSYLEKEKFISAIELQNNSIKSGCFFVETEDEYYLIDIHCS